MKINENGRSMVEMLGVLAIIGVLSAGGLAGYSKAMFKHKLNNTIDEVTMLVTNIRTMYGAQTSYAGLGDDDGVNPIALGIVPANFVLADNSITNPFKGSISLAAGKAKSGDDDGTAFKITVADIPQEACVTLASADWGSGAGSGFIGVVQSDGDGEPGSGEPYVGTTDEGKVLSISDAATVCALGNNGLSSVTLKFY